MDEKNLLLVDDDEELCRLLTDYLGRDGYQVTTCGNGREGLELARAGAYGLVLLDVMLPDINGKDVCQRVRSDKNLDNVRIICISGMVEEDKVDELKAAGADDFLRKPFEVDRLIERICALLDVETTASSR